MLDWLTETLVIARWKFVFTIVSVAGLGTVIIWLRIKLLKKRKNRYIQIGYVYLKNSRMDTAMSAIKIRTVRTH